MTKFIFFIIFIALSFFTWGFASGVYHVFPYDSIFEIKNSIYDKNNDNIEFEILDVDIESLIHISNQNDLD